MIALALALAAATPAACQTDRDLPAAFADWRYARSAGELYPFSRGLTGNGSTGLFDYTDLPAAVGPAQIRHFSVGRAGDYAVAKNSSGPVLLYGSARDAQGKRQPVTPVARRGGPACTSIVAIDLYRLAPGDYYAVTPRLPEQGAARTLVTRLN